MTVPESKTKTTVFACPVDIDADMFHAHYIQSGGTKFLYNVRKVSVKEAYALNRWTYDRTVREGVPVGTTVYWYAAEESEYPL